MTTGPSPSHGTVPFGDRLRAARVALGLTLDQLATATGLSKGFLSRVERNESSPSVSTLVTLCEVMNIEVGTLFRAPQLRLIKREDAEPLSNGGHGIRETELTPRSERLVQLIHSTVDPGGHAAEALYSIECEVEVVYVLAGSVEVRFANETVALTPGDALTFPGREPHTWRNASDTEPAEVMWAISPAPWRGSQ